MRHFASTTSEGATNVKDGPLFKIADDPRVTRVGKILRATSIDELPQLLNVIRGDMSLVGPRPALPREVASFDAEHLARQRVRPGVTGLWQIEGRDNPSFSVYRRLDLFYVENWSLRLDAAILARTVSSVAGSAIRALHSHVGDEGSGVSGPGGLRRRRAPVIASQPLSSNGSRPAVSTRTCRAPSGRRHAHLEPRRQETESLVTAVAMASSRSASTGTGAASRAAWTTGSGTESAATWR